MWLVMMSMAMKTEMNDDDDDDGDDTNGNDNEDGLNHDSVSSRTSAVFSCIFFYFNALNLERTSWNGENANNRIDDTVIGNMYTSRHKTRTNHAIIDQHTATHCNEQCPFLQTTPFQSQQYGTHSPSCNHKSV